MSKKLEASENLALFDKLRKAAIDRTNEAIICTQEMMNDEDFTSLVEKTLEKLKYSRYILQDNTLPLSLMASFQTGKSTTTSAMADGHEITPCGKGSGGIRTSSIPVTIYNNGNSSELVINPYSKTTLVQHILDCCMERLTDTDVMSYDLDNENSRKILREAVEKEIENYRTSSNYELNKLSTLRNAILILSYYGSKSYQRLIKGDFKTISDIQPFIAFPNDLETRWEKLREYGFNIIKLKNTDGNLLFDEISSLHVFVDNIVIPVHSEFMGETGTAIIDAPGTMASNEDTERALKAASSAAVVLFLLKGEQQLSQIDLEMLRTLKNAGMADKVVFIVNFFKDPEVIKENIEPTILTQIKDAGYTAEHHKKLLYYNAYLAQRAAQGQLLLNNQMDSLTADSIIRDAKSYKKLIFNTLEEAWLQTTRKVLIKIEAEDTANELSNLGLCEQTIASISRESKWKEMITSLREHVMNNRVSGVLKDLGVQPVYDGLKSIEDALTAKEKIINETEKEVKTKYEEAKKLLQKFSEEVEDVISINLTQSADKAFAGSYYDDVVLGAIDDTGNIAAEEVFKETGIKGNMKDVADKIKRIGEKTGNNVVEFFTGDRPIYEHEADGLKEKCNAIISRHYKKQMLEKGHAWSQDLEYSMEYIDNIKTKVRHIQRSLLKTWEELGLDENEFLSEITPLPKDLSGLISKDAVKVEVRDIISNTTMATQLGISSLFTSVGIGFGTLVGGTWIYYFVLPMDFIIPGFAELITLASVIVTAVVYKIASKKKDEKIEAIAEEIKAGLAKTVSSKKKEIITNIIQGNMNTNPPTPGVSCIRLFYESLFTGIIEKQREELDRVYKEKMEEMKKTSEEREKIAQKANKWRTEHIKPIRAKLKSMLDEINNIWG